MRTLRFVLVTGSMLAPLSVLAAPTQAQAPAAPAPAAQASAAQTPATPAPVTPAPTVETPPAPRPTPRVIGTMSELMVKIIYPTSDAIFYIPTRTPKNDVEWGEVQNKALALAESANLLMLPGRMRDEDRWLQDAKLLQDVGMAAFKLAKAKDVEGLTDLNEQLYQSCVVCHMHYRPTYGRRPVKP